MLGAIHYKTTEETSLFISHMCNPTHISLNYITSYVTDWKNKQPLTNSLSFKIKQKQGSSSRRYVSGDLNEGHTTLNL